MTAALLALFMATHAWAVSGEREQEQLRRLKLQLRQLDQALAVPANAVQNNYVYLVKPDNTVTQRKITVGVTDGDYVSVRGELEPGDKVVTDGASRLSDGSAVVAAEPVSNGPRRDRPVAPGARRRQEQ